MLKRILNSRLPLIVYSPLLIFEIDFFKSSYNAGALPVLDTEYFEFKNTLEIINKLKNKKFLFGLRVTIENKELLEYITRNTINNLDLIIFSYQQVENLNEFIFNNRDYNFVIETIDIDINERLEKISPLGLILKGYEAPGRVSKYASFILMQWYLENSDFPVFIHGGVGHYTAAGIFASGCSGIVLDYQLYLCDESPLSENFKIILNTLKEGDSQVIGSRLNIQYRFFAKLATNIVKQLDIINNIDALFNTIRNNIAALKDDNAQVMQSLFPIGQDAVFSKHFKNSGNNKSNKIKDVIYAFFKNINSLIKDIEIYDPIKKDSLLAKENGTKYPIMQGAMANITDNADFAKKVFKAGALPFFALGALPEKISENIIKNGLKKLDNFGVGMIGIANLNPNLEIHLKQVNKYNVKYALFAGVAPEYVNKFEKKGVKTYLHTPSISILTNAVSNGCSRFIMEGTEAGGHVGSLTSFVLWELALNSLEKQNDKKLKTQTIVFAGGVSTRTGSNFISGISSGISKKGLKVGVQLGTAYLFTDEIVKTKSLKKIYRRIIKKNNETILIGNTIGLSSRTVISSFSKSVIKNEYKWIDDNVPLRKRKKTFEKENFGSLLIGAKGNELVFKNDEVKLKKVNDDELLKRGNFLVGDSLAFYSNNIKIEDIHHTIIYGKDQLYKNLNELEIFSNDNNQINDEIAIIGMGCTLPGAKDPETLWENIISKKSLIKELTRDRFDIDLYYSENKKKDNKTYSKIAGIIDDFVFDFEKYGYTPEKVTKISRSQQIILETAYQAVDDSGYLDSDGLLKNDLRPRTAVIVATCLGNELGNDLYLKYFYPEIHALLDKIDEFRALEKENQAKFLETLRIKLSGTHQDYDNVHGAVLNVEASRIANHLGITGANYVVDAACATSLAAVDCGCKELLSGNYDAVIVGGVNSNLSPEPFVGFSKMGVLSSKGSWPFDERADGFVIGEGAGVFVLKRVKDAIRDNDTILGIIKSIGSSSDGKGKAIAAPNSNGQQLCLKRCFEKLSGKITVSDIDYIEAHGTATIPGDTAEVETIKEVYNSKNPVGISSIKSQIGHLLGGAGAAGLVKLLIALNKKILPPNGQFEKLSSEFNLDNSSVYIIKDAKKWEKKNNETRKAAISSYGFGGINYHSVIEEYTKNYIPLKREVFKEPDYDFNDNRIVISGLGVVLPGAENVDKYWQRLVNGDKVISSTVPDTFFHNKYYAMEDKGSDFRIPEVKFGLVNNYKFNNVKYKIPPSSKKSIDRAQFFALDAANQAITQSNLFPQLKNGNRVAVILGTIPGNQQVENVLSIRSAFIEKVINDFEGMDKKSKAAISEKLLNLINNRYAKNTEDTIPGFLSNIISGRIANFFGCNGVNYTVDASCASSTVAIDMAVKGLKSKDYDYVITGGVDTNSYPAVMIAFKKLGLLSDTECRFFDKRSNGYVMGEGAALQVITTYKNAVQNNMPIFGELYGLSFNASAPDHLLSPSQSSYSQAIDNLYNKISIRKNQISHLDVFGVSTLMLDNIEKQAIEQSFKNNKLYFGNIKPEFGYFKSANPAVAFTKVVLMNMNKTILPNFSYSKNDSIVNNNKVLMANDKIIDLSSNNKPIYFALNVNGIGGNHGHMVVGSLPEYFNENRLKSSNVNAELVLKSDKNILSAIKPSYVKGKQRIVTLLSGQGAQHPGMMKELYYFNPVIQKIMDEGEKIFQEERGYSLLEIMFSNHSEDSLNLTENTQPAVFLSTVSIYDYLEQNGFKPDYFVGHSVGEYSALYCNKMLSFEKSMKLILKRSDLMRQSSEEITGKIMVVFKNPGDAKDLIRDSRINNIYVANKNSEKQTAISGGKEEIEKFCKFLSEENIIYKKLQLSGAFHTKYFSKAAERLEPYLEYLDFYESDYTRIISNVTAKPHSKNIKKVKKLLVNQIVSPVEFIKSIEFTYQSGRTHYIEIGPGNLLVNLLNNINILNFQSIPAIDPKKGEKESLEYLINYLEAHKLIFSKPEYFGKGQVVTDRFDSEYSDENEEFNEFKNKIQSTLNDLLYEEFQKYKRSKKIIKNDGYNFCTDKIVVSGVSIGLPGKGNRVFDRDNFRKILAGVNFIDPLSQYEKEKITDKNITRIYKQPDGNAKLMEISSTEDVMSFAGQLGKFNLRDEYGIDRDYDLTMAIAIAAGIEALRDANIPLVMEYKDTTSGGKIADGFALPKEMQDETGVIVASAFPNSDTMIHEMNNYYYHKFYVKPYDDFENIFYHLMEIVKDLDIKGQITDWFFKVKERRKQYSEYKFNKDFALNLCPLGSAHLAQIIKAKGPNILLSGACASTTQAIGVAEDWIRTGRCKRVIVIGGETPTSEAQNQWVGSMFLALGAATVEKRLFDAAKPFDSNRNGTILGSGAVSIIIEREEEILKRGLNGQAEIIGTQMGNSAFHALNIDVKHLASEMVNFISKVEKTHHLKKDNYTPKTLFMSHETYTPARGGSADAEVTALKKTFPDHYKNIAITNTKGYTGHTMGAGIEDAILVKALQKNTAPPIPNLVEIPDHFKDLKFNDNTDNNFEYGMHLAAGFGSHFAFVMFKKINENSIENNHKYYSWLQKISGVSDPQLTIIDNKLCIESSRVQNFQENIIEEKPVETSVEVVQQVESKKVVSMEEMISNPDDRIVLVIKKVIAEQTGYTIDMLDLDLDLESDLGIDTVKQVEIFGLISNNFNKDVPEDLQLRELSTIQKLVDYFKDNTKFSMEENAAHDKPESTDHSQKIRNTIQEIISDQTGYSIDMLNSDYDLESEFGIDTVKQVEIFSKLSTIFNKDVPGNLKLNELNTIEKLTLYFNEDKIQVTKTTESKKVVKDIIKEVNVEKENEILTTIKKIISEQTGYSIEMLKSDYDLELKFGIDTVKQVEIFIHLSTIFKKEVPENLKVKDLNTIQRLTDYFDENMKIVDEVTTHNRNILMKKDSQEVSLIDRMVVKIEEEPLIQSENQAFDVQNKTIIITCDKYGFADKVSEFIIKKKGLVIKVKTEKKFFEIIEKEKQIDGLIHLIPLNYYIERKSEIIKDQDIEESVKSFFKYIKALYPFLNRPDTIISSLSFNSVVFPYQKLSKDIHPTFAGISGMMKCVNKEMENTIVKMVDFLYKAPEKNLDGIVRKYVNEIFSGNKIVETGYSSKKRYKITLHSKEVEKDATIVNDNDTILITGGAGGITYEILNELVNSRKIKLIILDIIDISSIEEEFLNNDYEYILNKLKTRMKKAKPLDIKKAVEIIIRVKNIILNIENFRNKGIDVDYYCADVTDIKAIKNVVNKYKKIDGVLHAAGVEQSNNIDKKELPSFNLVFDVKVKGILNLLQAVNKLKYKYFITFSSITARMGNEGQIDYCSANDMIGRTLQKYKALYPNRIFKVYTWTAWSGTGMATNETVIKVLESRGIKFLPLKKGIDFFMNDLSNTSDLEVIFVGHDYEFDVDKLIKKKNNKYPFIDKKLNGENEYSRSLNLKKDLFFYDHTIEDVPYFLCATGIETMAEAVNRTVNSNGQIKELVDFSIPYGIKLLKGKNKDIIIKVNPLSKDKLECNISSVFINPRVNIQKAPKLHYQGTYIIENNKKIKNKKIIIPDFSPIRFDGDLKDLIYHPKRMFHGEMFHVIMDIKSFDKNVLITSIKDSNKKEFFQGEKAPNFFINPVILDGMFQTGGLFELFTKNYLILPNKIKKMQFHKIPKKNTEYLCLARRTFSDKEINVYQMELVDNKGNVYLEIEDFEMIKMYKVEEAYRIYDKFEYC